MAARYAVGIDIGGTKLLAGVINVETGEVVSSARKRTHPERGADFFSKRLLEVVSAALAGANGEGAHAEVPLEIVGVGVGVAGQVDRAQGVLLSGPNLGQGLDNFPLSAVLAEHVKAPVTLGNDVEVATLGEQAFGAGRDCDDFVCVFIGTGVGAGIVQDGHFRRGVTGTAGEIGHTIVQYGGRICGCGGRGHLEAYASRTAITLVLQAELRRGRVSKLSELLSSSDRTIRSKLIARCIDEGDELVIDAISEAADFLGAGLGSLASFYNPRRIILGGGLIEATHLLFDRAGLRARETTLPAATRSLDILRAALGDNSGIVGAAWMANNAVTKR